MLIKSISPEVLVASAKEIFETMIFLDLQSSEPSDDHWDSDTLLGTITFTGDIEGCLGICTREDGAKTVAASMLGMESAEDLSTQDIHDAMGRGLQHGHGMYQVQSGRGLWQYSSVYSHSDLWPSD